MNKTSDGEDSQISHRGDLTLQGLNQPDDTFCFRLALELAIGKIGSLMEMRAATEKCILDR